MKKKRHEITIATKRAIITACEAGERQAEIAERFGVSRSTVSAYWRRARKTAKRSLMDTPEEMAELRAAYEAGATLRQLVTRYELSEPTLRLRLHTAGTIMRSYNTPQTFDEVQLRVLYTLAGLTIHQIATKLGTSSTTVWRRLERMGLSRRDRKRI